MIKRGRQSEEPAGYGCGRNITTLLLLLLLLVLLLLLPLLLLLTTTAMTIYCCDGVGFLNLPCLFPLSCLVLFLLVCQLLTSPLP